MAGLVAFSIDALFGLIKTILSYAAIIVAVVVVMALIAVLVVGIGVVAHYLLALIGISDAGLKISSSFESRAVLGFLAVSAGYALGGIIWLIIKIPPKAKKFGDRYFNSIGDKKQTR